MAGLAEYLKNSLDSVVCLTRLEKMVFINHCAKKCAAKHDKKTINLIQNT